MAIAPNKLWAATKAPFSTKMKIRPGACGVAPWRQGQNIMTSQDGLAALASRLGILGLVPFIALAAGAAFGPGTWQSLAALALLAYGATIVSFLGGIYWGLAIAPVTRSAHEGALFLVISVVPQLLGWLALIVPPPWGHWVIAAALLALLALDQAAVRSGLAPPWFGRLRRPLSIGAAIAMITGALVT